MNPYYKPYWLNEDELEHYGVKGMKWGIRKDRKEKADRELSNYKKKQLRKMYKAYNKQVNKKNKITKKKMVDDWHEQSNARAMRLHNLYGEEFEDIMNLTYNQMRREKASRLPSKQTRRGEQWVDQYFEKTGLASDPYSYYDHGTNQKETIYPLIDRAIRTGMNNTLSEKESKLAKEYKEHFKYRYR